MMKWSCAAFACLAMLVSLNAGAGSPLVAQVLPMTWKVTARLSRTLESVGTGVMLAPDKIVTDCHVTRNARTILVTNAYSGKTFTVTREAYDLHHDLCLLVAPGSGSDVATIDQDTDIPKGTPVFTVGYPLTILSVAKGKVLTEKSDNNVPVLQTSVRCNHGNSGGGLFNSQGQLVGITAFITNRYNGCNALTTEWLPVLLIRTPLRVHKASGAHYFWVTPGHPLPP